MNPFASILSGISDWAEHRRDTRGKGLHSTHSNLTGPGGRQMPRTESTTPSRRKNPIPGGRGHYTFTGPAGPSFHARKRRGALLACISGGN